MTRRAREIETLLLTMYAALPLYVTGAVSIGPLLLFHMVMAGIVIRVAMKRGPELIPATVMRWVAFAYVPLYVVDATMLSRSAIAASTHLVLFIAAYQPIESMNRDNQTQRLLTSSLIFIASLSTSTHLSVILFVAIFAFLMFRQLMYVSHLETVKAMGRSYAEPPTIRPAGFYLAGSALIGLLLFPLLPRIRNPFMQGITGSLGGAATGLSETIDFSKARLTSPESTVFARVWMDRTALPFFTPIRLRGPVYDRYLGGEWRQSMRGLREIRAEEGTYVLGRARGVERVATVQQRARRGKLFLPVGTVAISGLPNLFEGPAYDTYYTYTDAMVNASVRMAYEAEPLRLTRVRMSGYIITPEIEGMARGIVGDETRVDVQAALIENFMVRNFRYLPNPTSPEARTVSLDQFLLRTREGHCEYFAAGMVVLLNALDVPARIAGGFYGGRLNPLTGYYSVRSEDAHAWTEVWDGGRWLTFDATPPSLRPGTADSPFGGYLAAVADSMNFFWDRYVLTFGVGDQIAMIGDALEWARNASIALRESAAFDLNGLASGPFVFFLVLIVAAGLAAIVLQRRRDPLFASLAARLEGSGIEIGPATTLEDALRLLRERDPESARALAPLVSLYDEERFSPHRRRGRLRELRRRLAEL